MSDRYLEFYRKMSLLEINTICKHEISRNKNKKSKIFGVLYQDAYSSDLEKKFPFSEINWKEDPFPSFKILEENPPKKLVVQTDGSLKFEEVIKVKNWDTFIDSFRQVRNNLTHGAKYFKGHGKALGLDDRDNELIDAALAFIKFLQNEGFVQSLD